MTRRIIVPVSILLAAVPAFGAAQISVRAGAVFGRGEHRVHEDGVLVASSGTIVGGALALSLRGRFQIRGEAVSGQLSAPGASLEDHDLAEVQILAGMRMQPWLVIETGLSVRNFSNSLATQHWSAWQVGAEARVPLGFETVEAVLRGYWLPIVSVSGLPHPDVALATGVGVDWRGRRLGVSALYSFERFDFPATTTTQRLEELSTFRVRLELWWPPARSP